VHNRLDVDGRSPLRSNMEVEKDIQDELLWSPFVDSGRERP
jgi:hypothetical protein